MTSIKLVALHHRCSNGFIGLLIFRKEVSPNIVQENELLKYHKPHFNGEMDYFQQHEQYAYIRTYQC